jgi:phosphohistidine phosphatase
MMRLVIVRHGRAIERDDPNCPPEAERYLTDEGKKRTRQVARQLAAVGLTGDRLLSSPYRRALETAEIFCRELGLPVKSIDTTKALLPDAPATAFLSELRALDAKHVLCFGHAPHVDRLVARLLGSRRPITQMKKSGVAGFDIVSLAEGRARLAFFLPPAVLRR